MQLKLREVARIMRVPERTVQRWITQEGLPGRVVAGQCQIQRASLLEWALIRRLPVGDEMLNGEAEWAVPGKLAAALEAGCAVDLTAPQSCSCSREGNVLGLASPERLHDREFFEQLVTGESGRFILAGHQMAIPHPRQPVIMPIAGPQLSVCRLEQPRALRPDGKSPAEVVFVLVSPSMHCHVGLLTALAMALNDPEFRRQVAAGATQSALAAYLRTLSEFPESPTQDGDLDAALHGSRSETVGACPRCGRYCVVDRHPGAQQQCHQCGISWGGAAAKSASTAGGAKLKPLHRAPDASDFRRMPWGELAAIGAIALLAYVFMAMLL